MHKKWKITAWTFCGVSMFHTDTPDKKTYNHEMIHLEQWKEVGWIKFLKQYFKEYKQNKIRYNGNKDMAYRMISFEREAYANARNQHYLKTRETNAWKKYMTSIS